MLQFDRATGQIKVRVLRQKLSELILSILPPNRSALEAHSLPYVSLGPYLNLPGGFLAL